MDDLPPENWHPANDDSDAFVHCLAALRSTAASPDAVQCCSAAYRSTLSTAAALRATVASLRPYGGLSVRKIGWARDYCSLSAAAFSLSALLRPLLVGVGQCSGAEPTYGPPYMSVVPQCCSCRPCTITELRAKGVKNYVRTVSSPGHGRLNTVMWLLISRAELALFFFFFKHAINSENSFAVISIKVILTQDKHAK